MVTITNTGIEFILAIILIFTYFVLYKKSKLIGDLAFIFIAIGTLFFTFDNNGLGLSIMFIVLTLGNFIFDVLNPPKK